MESVVVVGAGISGLAAAYRLTEGRVAVTVLTPRSGLRNVKLNSAKQITCH
jgi:protoporphyrinogen oxidase